MAPPSYMRSVVDRNVVMRHMTVILLQKLMLLFPSHVVVQAFRSVTAYSRASVCGICGTLFTAGTYVVGSKSFRPDIQKPRQMENVARDIYGEVNL